MSLRTGIMVKAISMTGVLVVKMKDVAELAGVSSAAVSRYLNGGYISADKAERIKHAIELTGYVRSSQARALRTGSTKLIGVIVPKINSESVSRITAGIGQVLGRRGYQMLLTNTDNVPDRELEYLDLFQNHPVDGIVLVATMITDEHRRAIESCRVPIVLIGQNVEGAACVYHDDYDAAFELGRALAGRVDGKIAYIGVTEEDRAAGYDRRRGFEAGLRAAGASLDPSLIRQGSFTLDSGYGAARELLSVAPDVSLSPARLTPWRRARCVPSMRCAVWARALHRVSGFGDNAIFACADGRHSHRALWLPDQWRRGDQYAARRARWRGGGERSQDAQARSSAYECLDSEHICLPLRTPVFASKLPFAGFFLPFTLL